MESVNLETDKCRGTQEKKVQETNCCRKARRQRQREARRETTNKEKSKRIRIRTVRQVGRRMMTSEMTTKRYETNTWTTADGTKEMTTEVGKKKIEQHLQTEQTIRQQKCETNNTWNAPDREHGQRTMRINEEDRKLNN